MRDGPHRYPDVRDLGLHIIVESTLRFCAVKERSPFADEVQD